MSGLERISLPTNVEFGLAEVDLLNSPTNFPVMTPELPGRSDDELRHAAQSNGEWDLYDTHGIDQNPLSYGSLWNRFRDSYRGQEIDSPGGFIKEVLRMQRQLPTAKEYSAGLVGKGLLTRNDAEIMPDVTDESDLDKDGDETWAYHKLWYLANATVPELQNSELANKYASNWIKAVSNNDEKARSRAFKLLDRARGVGDDSAATTAEWPAVIGRRHHEQLINLGVPGELLPDIYAAPRPKVLYPRFSPAEWTVSNALSDRSIDRQIAIRQFFGVSNLVKVAIANTAVERPFGDSSLAFSLPILGMGMAGTLMIHSEIDLDQPFTSIFRNEELAKKLRVSAEQLAELGALATYTMHEPGLCGPQNHLYPRNNLLGFGSHVVDMVTSDYRIWLDRRSAMEK